MPPPLLSINFFATGNFLKHSTEGFPYEVFWHCETNNFRRKILMPPPPLIHKFFPYRKFFETEHRRGPLRSFLALWDMKNSTENPATSTILSIKFRNRKCSETQHRRFPIRNFGHSETNKTSTENLEPPPLLSINFFATGNFLKHSTEGFAYEVFWHCET